MEAYKSTCPDCGRTYRWIGYKTGIGKTEQQLAQMKKDHTVCRYCGSDNLKTGLDYVGLIEAYEERERIRAMTEQAVEKIMREKGLL